MTVRFLSAVTLLSTAAAISTVPYDGTLVLGNVVSSSKIMQLMAIAESQQKLDLAQDKYNALLRARLSLDLSLTELGELGLGDDPKMRELTEKKRQLDDAITKALANRLDARLKYNDDCLALVSSADQSKIGEEPESPLDFSLSKLKSLPLASDALTLDVQYFRNDDTVQGSRTHARKVSSWVSASINSMFGSSAASGKPEQTTESHMNKQMATNELLGTLVIFASATHKNVRIFSPTKYDPLKLVAAWNGENPQDRIDLPAKVKDHYKEWVRVDGAKNEGASLKVLTGVSYGSSFVGFIHFVKNSQAQNTQKMHANAELAEAAASLNNFIGSITGGFGLDEQTASDLRQMVSSNEILSHVGLITHGIMPSLASQNIATSLKDFIKFSPESVEGQLEALGDGENTDAPDMDSLARSNVRAGRIASVHRNTIKSVLSGLQESDHGNNKVIDMNALMRSLDDYIKNAREAEGGMPVEFYLASIGKKDVLAAWFKEFRPELYRAAMNGQNPWDDEESKKKK